MHDVERALFKQVHLLHMPLQPGLCAIESRCTPCGGRVDIEALKNGQEVVVLIKDNGIGITPDDLPRMWDRLYRSDKSRSQRGLGLGLSLVKAVVQAHHGKIEAATNASGGSRFSLYLPLSPRPSPNLSGM